MRNVFRSALVGLGLVGLSVAAQAEPLPYVGGEAIYFVPDSNRDADDGYGGRLFFGYPLGSRVNLELGMFGYTYERDSDGGDDDGKGAQLDLMIPFMDGRFRPFALIGGGWIQEDVGPDTDDSWMANVGLGALIGFTDKLFLRTDARYVAVMNDLGAPGDDPLYDWHFGLGLQTYFGGEKPAPPPEACVDSDGDGVCDDADLCPGTPPGSVVDAKGCPIVEEQPAMNPVRKFEDVHFAFDKAELDAANQSLLDETSGTITTMIETYPDLKVEVSGHTDWIGTDGYNQGLSERRANTVKSYMVRKGVDASSIATFAYGESKPVAPNANADGSDNPEGRALNRRAEIETKSAE